MNNGSTGLKRLSYKKKIKYLGSKNCQILNQQKQEVLETIEKWTIILQPNSSSEAKIQDSWDRRTLTFILKRRQKWRMLNDFRWGLSLVCVASVMWIDVFFSPTDWRIERQMMDREISNLKESMYQWCNKYCQGQLFWSWFFISQILISFKKCLKGSKAMSNISFLANFKNWSDFKISLITLFVNLSTCCTNSWNLSFSLQVHALITFITGWTKLEP